MANNPFNGLDVNAYDGKEVGPGIFILGPIAWNNEFQRWTALADTCGTLAVIELRVTVPSTNHLLAGSHHETGFLSCIAAAWLLKDFGGDNE